MNDAERALVDLVRMGLNGDAESVRQYARRLLRRAPTGDGPEGDFREALGELLLKVEATSPALRRGETPRTAEAHFSGSTAASGLVTPNRPTKWANRSPSTNEFPRTAAPTFAAGPEPTAPSDARSALQLARVESGLSEQAPVLNPLTRATVDSVLRERRREAALLAHGVTPSRTVLLTGAPGVGKTMTARYLAAALGVPLVTVDLAAVMSSFLGRTGQNLRQVLDYARSRPCVLLLDEFDALAKRRDDQSDVGELKRIVNVLLLELETWPQYGLLVAATNHPELLDRAIWRRFDTVINLPLPDLDGRRAILTDALGGMQAARASVDTGAPPVLLKVSPQVVDICALALESASGSDVGQFVRAAIRTAVLTDRGVEETLLDAVRKLFGEAAPKDRDARIRIARALVNNLGTSQRDVGELLGVSHVTVGNWLKSSDTPMSEQDTSQGARGRGRSSKKRT